MQHYTAKTLQALVTLLEKSISQNHEALQIEVLSLIGTISDVIQEEF